MPFLAVCPYCRKGQIRAPEHMIGLSATCPRCHSCFTLAPASQLPSISEPAAPQAALAAPQTSNPNCVLSRRPVRTLPVSLPDNGPLIAGADPRDVEESATEAPV